MTDLSPLKGARIWIAGSKPDGIDPAASQRFDDFLRRFGELVFRDGGSIVHGSHTTVIDPLIEAAKAHQENAKGSRDCLLLAASKFYYARYKQDLERWRTHSIVHEEPAVEKGEPAEREAESLKRLRHWMADRSDAVIAVGGKRWKENPGAAGVPDEFKLARQRGLPCFLLAGLSGAAAGYLQEQPDSLRNLRNGLSEQENRALAGLDDVERLARSVVEQLRRLPLVRGAPLGEAAFRILALDGGGIKGTFTAAVLATWEAATRKRLGEHFDLIAGTSTGGILALGLGMGLPAAAILKFYEERGPTVFPMVTLRDPETGIGDILWNKARRLWSPKYDSGVLRRELEAAFRDAPGRTLEDSVCRLVIPAVHALTGAAHVFCTNHHPELTLQAELAATKVALATAAAPTYFAAATVDDGTYLDGGLWANNPTLAAVVEAVSRLHVPLNRIDILSVGTTSQPYDAAGPKAGFIGWLKGGRIVNLLMHAQAQGAIALASSLAGRPRMLRVDQMLVPGKVSLDNIERIPDLKEYGQKAGSDPGTLADVEARFLNGIKAEPWTRYLPGGGAA
jgi:predicted acylesterase/phospholipase RssA